MQKQKFEYKAKLKNGWGLSLAYGELRDDGSYEEYEYRNPSDEDKICIKNDTDGVKEQVDAFGVPTPGSIILTGDDLFYVGKIEYVNFLKEVVIYLHQ